MGEDASNLSFDAIAVWSGGSLAADKGRGSMGGGRLYKSIDWYDCDDADDGAWWYACDGWGACDGYAS